MSNIKSQIERQLNGINSTINIKISNQTQQQISNINKQLTVTKQATRQVADGFEAFGAQAALAVRRFGAFVLATYGFRKLISGITEGIGEAIAFEREIVKIAQVTDSAVRDVKGLSDEVTRLATTLGVSSSKLLNAAQILAQAGYSADEVKKSLAALAKSDLAPTFDNIVQTTEGAIAVFQQFGKSADDLEGILSSINSVSAKFAVESSDLITAIRRTGGAFQAAGGNLNELLALFTSVRQTTRESAESIATGFRTIFTRLQRPATIQYLRELGIELTDLKGGFLGPLEAVRRLSTALQGIPSTDLRFAHIVEELGGFRQVSKVIPLIQQFDVAQRALGVAQSSSASLTINAAKAQDAMAVQIQKVREEFEKLIRAFADDATFRSFVNLALELSKALIHVADAIRPLAPALGALGAIGAGIAGKKILGSLSGGKGFLGNLFHFAGGGMVPGTGSGDTVPALLSPGEYVLNKRVVDKIGPENVAKFAGGTRRALSAEQQRRAARKNNPYIQNVLSDLSKSGQTQEPVISAATSSKLGPRTGKDLVIGNLDNPSFASLSFTLSKDRLGKDTPIIATSSIANLSKDDAAKLRSQYGVGPNARISTGIEAKFIQGIKKTDFVLSAQKGLRDSTLGLLRDLYPGGTKQGNLEGIIGNAVTTSNLSGAYGSLFEAFIASIAGLNRTEEKGNFDIPSGPQFKKAKGVFGGLFSPFGPSVQAADVKLTFDSKARASLAEKAARYGLSHPSAISVHGRKGFAAGGSVGSDNIPALLTPGEYVLDKDTTSSIGVSNLNKMQKFASGGSVGGGFSTGLGSGGNLVALGIITDLVASFSGLNGILGKLITTFGAVASQAGVLVGVFKLSTQIKDKEEAVATKQANFDKVKSLQSANAKEFQKFRGELGQKIQQRQKQGGVPLITQEEIDQSNLFRKRDRTFSAGVRGAQGSLSDASSVLGRSKRNIAIGAVAAGVGVSAGGLISDFAENRAAQGIGGFGTKALAAGGGILSGASTGASIGSVAGTPGIIVGGIIGAGAGLIKALFDISDKIEAVAFDKSLTDFRDALSGIEAGTAQPGLVAGTVATSFAAIQNRASTATGENKVAAQGELTKSLPALQQFFTTVAKGSNNLEEFIDTVGPTTLNIFAGIQGIPIDKVKKQYQDIITTQQKQITITRDLNAAQEVEARNLHNMIGLNAAIEDAQLAVAGYNSVLQEGVIGIGDFTSALQKTGSTNNQSQFAKIASFAGGSFGAVGGGLAAQATVNNKLSTALPDILLRLRNQNKLGEGAGVDFGSQLRTELEKIASGPGAEAGINTIVARVQDFIGTDEKQLSTKLGDATKAVAQFVQGLDEPGKALASATEGLLKQFNTMAGGLGQANKLILEAAVTHRASAADIQRESAEFQVGLVPGANFTAQPTIAANQAKLGNLGFTGNESVKDVGQSLIDAQKQLADTHAQVADIINAAGVKTKDAFDNLTDAGDALIRKEVDQSFETDRLKEGLQQIGHGAKAVADAQRQQLEQLKAERQARQSATLHFGGATGTERNQINETRRLVKGVAAGSINAGSLTDKQRAAVASELGSLPDTFKIGGVSAAKVRAQFATQTGAGLESYSTLTPGVGQTGAEAGEQFGKGSPEEQELQKKIVTNLGIASDAEIALAQAMEVNGVRIAAAMEKAALAFSQKTNTELKDVDAENTQRKKAADDAVRAEKIKADEQKKTISGALPGIGPINGPEDIARASKTLTNVQALQQKQTRERLFSEEGQTGILGSTKEFLSKKIAAGEPINPADIASHIQSQYGNAITAGESQQLFQGITSNETIGRAASGEAIGGGKLSPSGRLANLELGLGGSFFGRKTGGALGSEGGFLLRPENNAANLKSAENQVSQAGVSAGDITKEQIESAQKALANLQSLTGKASGGYISATDTVPAMLTPGEFVLNRNAVNNVGVNNLHAINAQGYASGGVVGDNGTSGGSFGKLISGLNTAANTLSNVAAQFKDLKVAHTISGQVEVIINGAEVMKSLGPGLQTLITAKIVDGLNVYTAKNFPNSKQITTGDLG